MKNKMILLSSLFLAVLLMHCDNPQQKYILKNAFEDEFMIGCALKAKHVNGNEPVTTAVVKKHFNSIVAENLMKPESLQPHQGDFNFAQSDQFVSFGKGNNMFVVGHTLVWHNQVPGWIFIDENGNNVSRDILIKRMKDHIHTVVSRYKGKVNGWDVVNEAVDDSQGLRNSKWHEIIGDDYIALAFQFAHEADPDAELYYNDYNLCEASKRKETVKLIKKLKRKGIPVDAVGMQGHYSLDYPNLRELEKSIEAFSELGVKVMITELDISVLPFPDESLTAEVSSTYHENPEYNPYTQSLPDSVQQQLAGRYADLFSVFLKHSEKISRVTFWGVNDNDSWKNNWPIHNRTDYPLLFDRNNKPKPALQAIIDLINKTKN